MFRVLQAETFDSEFDEFVQDIDESLLVSRLIHLEIVVVAELTEELKLGFFLPSIPIALDLAPDVENLGRDEEFQRFAVLLDCLMQDRISTRNVVSGQFQHNVYVLALKRKKIPVKTRRFCYFFVIFWNISIVK
jgi:hypothetical protein